MGPMTLLIVFFQILHVQSTSEAPELMVTPKLEFYMSGQSVTLTCLYSGHRERKGFTFLKDQTEVYSSPEISNSSKTYQIPQLKVSDRGKYSCKDWAAPTPYLESNPVWITVLELPKAPLFSVSPKREVYRNEEVITLTCSIPDNRLASKILFYQNRQELALLQPRTSLDTFIPSLLQFPQDGTKYSCKYLTMESSWEILSPESTSINISVMVGVQNPSAQLGYAALVVLLPILIAPLVYYYRKRGKASKSQQEFEMTDTREEIDLDHAGRLEAREEFLQEEKGSGVTYAAVRFCSAETPWKSRTEKGLEMTEQEEMLYSKVCFQPTAEQQRKK